MYDETDNKLITCIVPKGKAARVLTGLKTEKGIVTARSSFARGGGRLTSFAERGLGETTEKEMISVVVPADRVDEVFEYLYFEAEINLPHGGLMYVRPLTACTRFVLPDLPEEQ